MLLQVQLTSARKESWKNPQIALKKNQVDIESLPQTNEWADTDQQFCSENTFIEDMNTVTEFAIAFYLKIPLILLMNLMS